MTQTVITNLTDSSDDCTLQENQTGCRLSLKDKYSVLCLGILFPRADADENFIGSVILDYIENDIILKVLILTKDRDNKDSIVYQGENIKIEFQKNREMMGHLIARELEQTAPMIANMIRTRQFDYRGDFGKVFLKFLKIKECTDQVIINKYFHFYNIIQKAKKNKGVLRTTSRPGDWRISVF